MPPPLESPSPATDARAEPDRPIVPCHPAMVRESHRALVGSALDAVLVLKNLQRRARELDADAFAGDVARVTDDLAAARERLMAPVISR